MQNAMFYPGEGIRDLSGFVREKPNKYTELLFTQTDEYIRQLKDFELRCEQPGADRKKLQAEVVVLNETMLDACAEFERNTSDPAAIKAAQVEFREKTNSVLSKSYAIKRTRTWPQGHQGDYYTLEMAYKNSPMSEGIGYYLDKYMLTAPLAYALRDRIVKLRDLLKEDLSGRRNPRVLDLACGSCREVFELASEIKASGAKFTCVDLDEDALNYALDRLTLAGLTEDHVELRKYNALRIFDFDTALMEFGRQDIIYSVGYFDYLPDDFLIKLLSSLYRLLLPGGKLIAAFKDANRYRPQIYRWLVNWDGFLQRTEDDFERLLHYANIPEGALSMTRVDSGSIVFYTAENRR
jgi:extracellular factor (EF) 3-hydroxypalmitic acid methyl ester biosynthesis protein